MKIAVLAKDYQDFKDFLNESHSNKKAKEAFIYIQNVNKARGVYFDAVIKTASSWSRAENYDIYNIIAPRIKDEK